MRDPNQRKLSARHYSAAQTLPAASRMTRMPRHDSRSATIRHQLQSLQTHTNSGHGRIVGSWYHPDGRQTKSTKTKRALSYDLRLSFVCLSFVKRRRYEYRFRKLVVTQLQQQVTSKSRPVRRRPLMESPTEPLIGSYCALLTPSRCPLQRPKKEIVDHQRYFINHTALMAALAAPVTTSTSQ